MEEAYCYRATGELEKAAQISELLQQTYPRDASYYLLAMGLVSTVLGNWEKALEEHRAALHLEPNSANYMNIGNDYTSLNRLEEAEAVYKQAEERKLENEFLLDNRYLLAFLKGDTAQMARLVSAAVGKPGAEDLLLAAQADTEG